jgi:uncharacterized membrane protein
MRCPLCAVEGPLVDHLLRDHPGAQLVAGVGLSVGTVAFSRHPEQLLRFYLVVLVAALLISLSPGRSRN